MRFAAAISEHPIAADAVGEVLGSIVEQQGVGPDLVLVFASRAHSEFLGEIGGAIRTVLRPATLAGCAAGGVLGAGTEAEEVAALSVWAAWGVPARPCRISAGSVHDDGDGPARIVDGVPRDLEQGTTLLLLADPFTFPTEGFLEQLGSVRPDLTLVGGLASAGDRPGTNRFLLDEAVHGDGAVAVALPASVGSMAIVSQGCRPVGEPVVVTRAENRFLIELAGKPALERLTDLATTLPPDDRVLLSKGVHLGVVIDEQRDAFGPGDFLVRNVLGADRERGVLAVGTAPGVGTTVQFHVRDADSASRELRHLLEGIQGSGALVFTCNGRGSSLFGPVHHDATVVTEATESGAVAGMFCAGEIGPVGGTNFLHGYTASVLVFP